VDRITDIDDELDELINSDPKSALLVIVEAASICKSDRAFANLAAGPLDHLLSWIGFFKSLDVWLFGFPILIFFIARLIKRFPRYFFRKEWLVWRVESSLFRLKIQSKSAARLYRRIVEFGLEHCPAPGPSSG
jgi:hypothetical protein